MGGNCVQEHSLPYHNPSEHFLDVTGTIEEGMKYVITVTYFQLAEGSGCGDYDKETGMCRVKPITFTYQPQIKGRSHHVHIPLKELSPGPNSWWKPQEVSICVGPTEAASSPHQCQRLFRLAKQTPNNVGETNLQCSKTWWCKRTVAGSHRDEIRELNREYRVNMSKDSSH